MLVSGGVEQARPPRAKQVRRDAAVHLGQAQAGAGAFGCVLGVHQELPEGLEGMQAPGTGCRGEAALGEVDHVLPQDAGRDGLDLGLDLALVEEAQQVTDVGAVRGDGQGTGGLLGFEVEVELVGEVYYTHGLGVLSASSDAARTGPDGPHNKGTVNLSSNLRPR